MSAALAISVGTIQDMQCVWVYPARNSKGQASLALDIKPGLPVFCQHLAGKAQYPVSELLFLDIQKHQRVRLEFAKASKAVAWGQQKFTGEFLKALKGVTDFTRDLRS